MSDSLAAVYDYIDAHAADAVDQLVRLCRQPSVSAQNVGLQEMAELLVQEMQAMGISTRLLPTSTGVPVVYGELVAPAPNARC